MNYDLHLLRRPQVEAMPSLSRATIYRYMKEGKFPKSHSLGSRIAVWKLSEVQDWIRAQVGY